MKSRLSIFSLFFLFTASQAFADITVNNNTNYSATAYVSSSPCSSKAPGDKGIIGPHSSGNVPSFIIGTYCGFSNCDAHVYLTKDCWNAGKEIAIATLNVTKGVISIRSLDPLHYTTSGSGNNVSISQVHLNDSKHWYNFWS